MISKNKDIRFDLFGRQTYEAKGNVGLLKGDNYNRSGFISIFHILVLTSQYYGFHGATWINSK